MPPPPPPPPESVELCRSPRRRHSAVIVVFFLVCSLSCYACEAQKLVEREVEVLRKIATKLNIKWDFSVDPCSGSASWDVPATSNTNLNSSLTCDCNTTNECHVTSILLKGQNLTGLLPDEFANLTSLSVLDLSRNYLNGSIPVAWSSLPLTQLSLLGNRISGSIPKELGSIITLQQLVVEANQLQGPIPAALSRLINLNRFLGSANNFSGELPESLSNLKNMTDLEHSQLLGKLDETPTTVSTLVFVAYYDILMFKYGDLCRDMQGTSLEGPFPSNFATLESITELRVSDLKGGDGKFPPLQNMKNMIRLVLRNLSISGEIPPYIGQMTSLKTLDLSFNNLMGPIPSNLNVLSNSINYMYLTNNMLTGTIPDWILSINKNIDISYNNFTGPSTELKCQQGYINLVASYSPTYSNPNEACLSRTIPCSGKAENYNLFINCGGSKVTVGDNEYEEDTSQLGPSFFTTSNSGKWAYSSTGDFLRNDKTKYLAENVSGLNISNQELYMTARLTPLSLRYYGLCLQKGNYSVSLHFAEIMFTSNETYSSVGRRLFDVYIQGKKVLQDFNIAKEANGTGREITKNFTTIVNDTLEIHFQWTGKGTINIPQESVYGPLISAISVTPKFKPHADNKLSVGAILGIVAASCVVVVSASILCWFFFKRKGDKNDELRGLELQTGIFSMKQIKAATNDFDPANKIGEGGFGPVYKGVLPDGSMIAVKQLSSKSKQGNREFINEIGMISAVHHPNLVKLFGCCVEGSQLLLIYEYLENNSLARALFGPERYRLKLDWQARRNICLGIARGLTYLHEESRIRIVHRDIKATNILLDKDLNAKISDFGLARLDDEENTHISTRIAGTVGYMAPEYATRGYLTDKADVYSFGVVILEIVSGMSNTNYRPKEEGIYLLDWAYVLQERKSLLELVDSNLGTNYSKEEALQMLNLALVCTNPSPTLRPPMSSVVSMLEGKMPVQVQSANNAVLKSEEGRFKALEKLSQDSQPRSTSAEGPWVDDSSVSIPSIKEETTSFLYLQSSGYTD